MINDAAMQRQGSGMAMLGAGNTSQSVGAVKQTAQPAPDTLLRALSNMESLNKRLADLSSGVNEIAVTIGGPWPCEGENPATASPTPPPAMVMLNASVDQAHRRICDIEHAVAAIRRSLGG